MAEVSGEEGDRRSLTSDLRPDSCENALYHIQDDFPVPTAYRGTRPDPDDPTPTQLRPLAPKSAI